MAPVFHSVIYSILILLPSLVLGMLVMRLFKAHLPRRLFIGCTGLLVFLLAAEIALAVFKKPVLRHALRLEYLAVDAPLRDELFNR